MAMGRPKAALVLSAEAACTTGKHGRDHVRFRQGLVSRVRIVLLSAAGKTNQQIALQLGLS